MAGSNEQELAEQAAATPEPAAGGDAPAAATEQNPKGFVPFFNEEYEFKLGSFGETGPAIRLSIAFGVMLLVAGFFYCATLWWVGHPADRELVAPPAETAAID